MSTEDLAILADALTFALIATVGGLILWVVIRSTWRRPALQSAMKVSVSAAALIAIGIAGVAVWAPTREGVTTVAALGGVDVGRSKTTEVLPFDETPVADFAPAVKGRPARVVEVAAIGIDGGTDPSPTPGDLPGDPGGGGGGGGGGSGGTTPPPPDPACSDDMDNDGDGKTDFPADPGCDSATDDTEAPDPPPPPPACNDGTDNDGDGLTDFPADPGCMDASDDSEPDPASPSRLGRQHPGAWFARSRLAW